MSPTAKFITAYAGYVAAIHLIPNGPWTKWKKGRVVDAWTLTHVAWSIIAKEMGVSLKSLMTLATINEVGEAIMRRARPDLAFGSPEGPLNVTADLVTNYAAYRLWKPRG